MNLSGLRLLSRLFIGWVDSAIGWRKAQRSQDSVARGKHSYLSVFTCSTIGLSYKTIILFFLDVLLCTFPLPGYSKANQMCIQSITKEK